MNATPKDAVYQSFDYAMSTDIDLPTVANLRGRTRALQCTARDFENKTCDVVTDYGIGADGLGIAAIIVRNELVQDSHRPEPWEYIHVHDEGTMKPAAHFVEHDVDCTIYVGPMRMLPPRARLSTYDVGDKVVVTAGRKQGVIDTVALVQEKYSGGYADVAGVAHRFDSLAAVFPDGNPKWYAEILPGTLRFPPGVLVRCTGPIPPGCNEDDRWLVVRWKQGLALLQSLDDERQRRVEKRHLVLIPA